ncbi:hypothetical protein [Mesorhizobium sp. M2E.F.Ca.ET.166.01.1.1]|uniref:hypothetical protein n=1 Tax=Mesorhizobium sp. M2E.F.Ca.ET.166.01.1.1 TaxID=2500523 RepID=UPI001679FA9A|nr:hypothetical protein [Mesorhizobium sp. M2E.F.Ca.ET.166.01.1.1]
MPKSLFFAMLASAVALITAPDAQSEETKPAMTAATKAAVKQERSGLLPIDGLNYYYAIYGKG